MGRGVRNQKQWGSVSGPWEEDAAPMQNRQVAGRMWNSVVDMSFELLADTKACPRERGQAWRWGFLSHLDLMRAPKGNGANQLLFGLILAEESGE